MDFVFAKCDELRFLGSLSRQILEELGNQSLCDLVLFRNSGRRYWNLFLWRFYNDFDIEIRLKRNSRSRKVLW